MSATIHDLPDALLGRILGLCGQHEGCSITLVCKRWQAAFYAEPSLWRTMEFSGVRWIQTPCQPARGDLAQEAQWRHNVQLLAQRVGSMTEAANFKCLSGDLPQQLLQPLQPGLLKSLSLGCAWSCNNASLPSAAALGSFTGLTALCLRFYQLPLDLNTALAGMRQLCQLSLESQRVPEQLLSAAAQLTRLTGLLLRWVTVPAGSRAALALRSLSQLQHLELSFQAVDGEGMNIGSTAVVPPPASFAQLSRFKLDRCQFEGTDPVEFRTATFEGTGGAHSPFLLLHALADGTQLPRLLDALLPTNCRLASLDLEDCDVQPAAPCPRLSSLAELGLFDCRCSGDAAPVAGMAQQTPALRRLVIDNSDRIQELELSLNNFEGVPPVLAAAPQLRALDLSDSALLTLNESDVQLVLARMPALDCLILGPHPDGSLDDAPQQPLAVIELLRSSKPGLHLRLGTGEGSEDEYDWW